MIKLPDKKLVTDSLFKNFSTELVEKAKMVEFRVASSQPNIPTYLCAKQPKILAETVREYLAKHKGCLKPKSALSIIQEQKDQEMHPGQQARQTRTVQNGMQRCSMQQSPTAQHKSIGLRTIDETEAEASAESELLLENAKDEVEKMKELRKELLKIPLTCSIRSLNIGLERQGSEHLQGRTMLQLFSDFIENAEQLSQE